MEVVITMNLQICLLDTDGSYREQSFYKDREHEWVSLADIPRKRRLCSSSAQLQIRGRLLARHNRELTFIGSSHYHYVTLFLLEEIRQPFTLVVFDHHCDAWPPPAPGMLSCGSWVLSAWRRQPLLQQVVLIGCDPRQYPLHWPVAIGRRVAAISAGDLLADPDRDALLAQYLSGRHIHISVDKDVLSRCYADTDWDQGDMTLNELTGLIRRISQLALPISWDVCGELDCDIGCRPQAAMAAARLKNDQANQAILEAVQLDGLFRPDRAG